MIVHSQGLNCCGYIYNTCGAVISALVSSTDEKEIDKFLELGKEQDQLFDNISGVTFKLQVPGSDLYIAAYTLPTVGVYGIAKKAAVRPKKLEYLSGITFGGVWRVRGGDLQTTPLYKFIYGNLNERALEANHKEIAALTHFGVDLEMYNHRKHLFCKAFKGKGKTGAVVFADRHKTWVKEEAEKLHKEFNVLVDVNWHNPRYAMDNSAHDLRTMFFVEKEAT